MFFHKKGVFGIGKEAPLLSFRKRDFFLEGGIGMRVRYLSFWVLMEGCKGWYEKVLTKALKYFRRERNLLFE
jgi:hypothetical protein